VRCFPVKKAFAATITGRPYSTALPALLCNEPWVKLDATHEQNAWLQLPIHYNSVSTPKIPPADLL
jgi:hypothetical protein